MANLIDHRIKSVETKLLEQIQVAVELADYQSDDPVEAFDAHDAAGTLSSLKDLKYRAQKNSSQSAAQAELFSSLLSEISKIESLLHDFAKMLARNAEIGQVDVDAAPERHYKVLARVFEKKNKDQMRVISPFFWYY
jgi:hypothetical protein